MKLILTLLIVLIASASIAQDCKFNYNKADLSSGKEVQRIDLKVSQNHHLAFYQNGNDYFLTQAISFRGDMSDTINMGVQLKLRLHDNSIISLTSKFRAIPEFIMFSDTERTKYVLLYPCTTDELKLIAQQGFTIFSYTFDQREDFAKLKKKAAQKTALSANCILQQ